MQIGCAIFHRESSVISIISPSKSKYVIILIYGFHWGLPTPRFRWKAILKMRTLSMNYLQDARQHSKLKLLVSMLSVRLKLCNRIKNTSKWKIAWNVCNRAFGENYLQEALDKIEALHILNGILLVMFNATKLSIWVWLGTWCRSLDYCRAIVCGDDQAALNICLQVNIDGVKMAVRRKTLLNWLLKLVEN